jgi:hypothetical protein
MVSAPRQHRPPKSPSPALRERESQDLSVPTTLISNLLNSAHA